MVIEVRKDNLKMPVSLSHDSNSSQTNQNKKKKIMSLQKKTHFSESEIFRLLDYHHQIMVGKIIGHVLRVLVGWSGQSVTAFVLI